MLASTRTLMQACTEMVMPMCTDGVHDMFPAEPVSQSLHILPPPFKATLVSAVELHSICDRV